MLPESVTSQDSFMTWPACDQLYHIDLHCYAATRTALTALSLARLEEQAAVKASYPILRVFKEPGHAGLQHIPGSA